MAMSASLRLYLVISYILLFSSTTVFSHPLIYGSSTGLMDSDHNIRQIMMAKRTLASGRWGLRPGKRSMAMMEPNYDYDPTLQQQQQIFSSDQQQPLPSQQIYHLFLLA